MRTRAAFILSFTAIITITAGSALGAYSGGTGEPNTPYQISNSGDWQMLMATSGEWDKYFILTTDISLHGITLTPVGLDDNTPFTGSFDGNGHVIRNADVNMPSGSNIGLFGYVSDGQISNLGLESIYIAGYGSVGALIGYNDGGTINNCYATGTVIGSSSGYWIGGLIGYNAYGTVNNCYATTTVSSVSYSYYIGGLIGSNGPGTISNCYATGSLSSDSNSFYVGGLLGDNSYGTAMNCFWDTQTSGISNGTGYESSNGITGETTAQMKTLSTFTSAGWNFGGQPSIWSMPINGYPILTWQTSYSGGSGDPNIPYQIATKADLLALAVDTNDYGKCFIMTADVNMQGQVFTTAIIAADANSGGGSFQGTAFTGTFNGNGHRITNFTINGGSNSYLGLFGQINPGGSVKNLGVENFAISGDSNYVGGLVGDSNGGSINNCYSIGAAGGFEVVGCLAGVNDGSITNCYSMGTVSGNPNSAYIGGMVGDNNSSVANCYSTCTVSGDSNSVYVGGLAGTNSGSVVHSFWDIQASGQATSAGGTGMTTAQMKTLSTFTAVGWNFNGNPAVWSMPISGYPILSWQVVDVPNVVGMAEANAQSAITAAGLVGTKTTAYSNSVAAGKIISQSPAAGAVVTIGSSVNYIESMGKPTVPNIVGMAAAAANTLIADANLVVGKVTVAYSNTVAAGKVISQSPAAGTKATTGLKVNYAESLGKPIVPDVLNMTSGIANTAISKAHLKVGTVTKAYSNTVPAGDVISTNPVAGTEVLIGSKVNYVKSLGEPAVPKIVGKKVADANMAISNATLVVGTVTTAYSNNIAVGKVISLSPVAGTRVAIGSDVNYVESLGKPTEPNIVGMAAADANAAIATAGGNLKVGKITAAYSNTVAAGNVISQSPAAGKKVTIGSAVNYVESLGKPIVPNVLGMTSGIANTAISKAHLKVGTVSRAYSDTVAAGEVVSTNPIAGTAVLIGSKVNYVKSLGKNP